MSTQLEYPDVMHPNRGVMHNGKLRLSPQNVIFKNSKNGKVETVQLSHIDKAIWRRVSIGFELKIVAKDGHAFQYDGFDESDLEALKKFFNVNANIAIEEQELSAKGWNWGDTNFEGYELSFNVDDKTAFEIPLMNVSQCTPGKNEVSLEFHQNDEAELSLMEMRFYIPPNDDFDTVEMFSENVMAKADILQAKGQAICTFQDLQCLTPRGRYDIRMYPKFIQLHGKTFDYKITYTSILRLFLLPHKDQRQIFFVVSLDPPIMQGQTRYHFLILFFYKDDEMSVELSLPEEEIEDKFGGKLQKNMSGPVYDVVSRVMKNMIQRKITVPGSFKGFNNEQSVTCSYKASSGFLFPLERAFLYVHKPPIHIRFEEIASVNFARGTTTNRSFDFEIETRSKTQFVFSNIERESYAGLFDFVEKKNLNIKNTGKGGDGYQDDSGSEEEEQHDAYLERMKQEAADREQESSDEESEDEDFKPVEDEEIAEDYDSEAKGSSGSDSDGSSASEKQKKKPKKVQKEKSKKRSKEEPSSKKKKAKKDPNAPKRPQSAYFQWLNDNREKIKRDNPGFSITDVSKEAGRLWKQVDSSEKNKYNDKYLKAKKEYEVKLHEYKASGGSMTSPKHRSPKKSKPTSSGKSKTTPSPSKFKSKEFIANSDTSSSEDEKKKKSESEEEASAESSAEDSGSDSD